MIKHQLLAKVNDTVCNAIKRSIVLLHCRKIIFLKCSLRICSHLSSWNPSLGWNQRESCLHDSRDPARHFFCISLQTISKPEEERISAAPKSATKPATCEEEAALRLFKPEGWSKWLLSVYRHWFKPASIFAVHPEILCVHLGPS